MVYEIRAGLGLPADKTRNQPFRFFLTTAEGAAGMGPISSSLDSSSSRSRFMMSGVEIGALAAEWTGRRCLGRYLSHVG